MHHGVQKEKSPENFCVLLLLDLWKYIFMGKKAKEKRRNEEKYVTTFKTLDEGFFVNVKKLF